MSSWDSQLSPQEVTYFKQLFQSASQSQEGIITGTEAVRFFASSGVPNQILSEIWEAADRDKVGYLTPETFAIALKLIACAQHGKDANANVLSTVVPLPQFEGVNIIAPSPAVTNTPLSNNSAPAANTPITPAEREKYINIFKIHQPVNGVLDGNTAKNVLIKSKLPMEILGQIWNLADTRKSGTLNQTEFIIAMHYIAKLMDGTLSTLPDILPPAVFQSASGTTQSPLMRNVTISSPSFRNTRQQNIMTPPQRAKTIDSLGNLAFGSPAVEPQWDVTPQEKQQFDAYFDKIDSLRAGVIQGKEAVEFFNNSRLPEKDLAHIWDLADIQQRGALSRDEFAIAMHLIHKRLAGKPLPTALPVTLLPPSSSTPQQQPLQQSPFGNSPVFNTRQVEASPVVQNTRSIFDDNVNADLLGDFSNDQISQETNQVNLMQNQISSLTTQTSGLQNQKVSAENALEQLIMQKKDLEAQLTNVRMSHEAAVKDLNEVQEVVRREESEWDRVRSEYDAAQQQLNTLQNEVAQANQTLENGRAETESLRRRINEIQEETAKVNAELDKLRAQTKQQGMMLDINRRQVTAAEQDRAQAKRHLEDYKAAGNLHNADEDNDSSDDNSTEAENEPSDIPTEEAVKTPEQVPSVVSTPALNNLFGSPTSQENTVSSPFDVFTTNQTLTSTPTSNTGGNDFDAIFGNLAVSSNTSTPAQSFDVTSWATQATSPTIKSSRGPPPPPPQSRHHRQPSESHSINSVTSAGNKKQRAPPPPPPTTTLIEENNKDEDDFEAAFSGNQLPEAKIVKKDDDFADFDDAFSAFDTKVEIPAGQTVSTTNNTTTTTTTTNTDWAASFDSFNFNNTDSNKPTTTTTATNEDDWDSIFGTPVNTKTEVTTSTTDTGFDDAFASFGDDFGKQSIPQVSSPVNTQRAVSNIGIVGDKIEELVKMGFAESEAKDALNRYDQDLEKASNFLLDQASKRNA